MTTRYSKRYGFTKSLAILCTALQLSACSGLEDQSEVTAEGTVTVSWTAPQTRADGTPMVLSEIGGYRVYYGTQTGIYTDEVDIDDGTAEQVTVETGSGDYFFVVTTVDTEGRESEFSQEITITI